MRLKSEVIHISSYNSRSARILPCFASRLRTSLASFAITYYYINIQKASVPYAYFLMHQYQRDTFLCRNRNGYSPPLSPAKLHTVLSIHLSFLFCHVSQFRYLSNINLLWTRLTMITVHTLVCELSHQTFLYFAKILFFLTCCQIC